jgi:hypothetical protein
MQAAINIANLKGEKGGEYWTTAQTDTRPGDFDTIYAHDADAVVTVVSTNVRPVGTLASVTVPKGSAWFCKCTSVTRVSGGAITAFDRL